VAFKLHPQLLSLLMHAFMFHEPFRKHKAAPWRRLFDQLASVLPLFDLRQHDPVLVRYFQCFDTDVPFLERLHHRPVEEWPAQMNELAKIWTPLDAELQARGHLLLRTLLQNAASDESGQPVLSAAQLEECLRPFFVKLSTNGWGADLQTWVAALEEAQQTHALKSFWPLIYTCISENYRAVRQIQRTEPFVSAPQLRQRGLLDIEEAQTWRSGASARTRGKQKACQRTGMDAQSLLG
jgi:hypothetical protein